MGCKTVNSWTLASLFVAFVELCIAYYLLCVSAFAFFPSKFLSFFEFCLPCPCSGFFGYQNSNLCLQKLLFEWPVRTIYSVQELVKSRFPFDLVLFKEHSHNLLVDEVRDRRCENGIVELEGKACSSSSSSPMVQSSVDKESGFDTKGRKIMNQKQKSGIRRRRRAFLGYGRVSSALLSNNTNLVGVSVCHPTSNGSEMRSEFSESLDPVSGVEDGLLDCGNVQIGTGLSGRFHHNFEFSERDEKGKGINENSLSIENFACNSEDRVGSVVNDANVIIMLQQALEEEKAARAALYQELEKERAAAATAADEAMAMILRLQEDKASIKMEARQYQRMIDEKFVYDEEEMDILKEILVRRETEIHFLEKEVEAYREMDFSGNGQVKGNSSYNINSSKQSPAHLIALDDNPLLLAQQIELIKSSGEKEATINANWLSSYELGHAPIGKEKTSKQRESSDLSTSTQSKNSAENVEEQRDIGMTSEGMKAYQTFGGVGEELNKKDGKCLYEGGCNRHSSMLDAESTVYDVHVVDDKNVIWKEVSEEECESLSSTALDSEVWRGKVSNDHPSTSMAESQHDAHESSLEMNGSSLLVNSQHNTLSVNLRRNSASVVDDERLKIDTEIEWLREKLRIVQEEKEKLTFSAEHIERVNAHLKLVEEIVNQLQEIQQLREPVRHTSLPPPSS